MVNNETNYALLFIMLFSTFIVAQNLELIEKKGFFDKSLVGDVILKDSECYVEGETTMKTFEIQVLTSGEYFLSAWIMKTSVIKNNKGLKFYIDDEKDDVMKLIPEKEGWQSSKLLENEGSKAAKIKLNEGLHKITFCSILPELPQIEFIKLSQFENKAIISEDNWNLFFEDAKKNTADRKKDTLSSNLSKINDNPFYLYDVQHHSYFTYTYFAYFYFNTGQIILETKKSNPYGSDPVMYLFNTQNPAYGSWGNDDGGEGYQSKITASIQTSGTYCVLIRSYYSNGSQTTDLYLNNNLYASNVVISGANLTCNHNLTEEINYFTSFTTGDPRLWIQRNDLTIQGYNDDYNGSGDHNWQQNARVKKSYSGQSMNKCIISSSSTYYPTGNCDVYMKCKNLPNSTRSLFSNYKADDAIMAGNWITPNYNGYNCFSWSGGITSYSETPTNPGSRFYVAGNNLASFDNYYNNNPLRYPEAANWNYTRSGATTANSLIDLWYHPYSNTYYHASINARWYNNPNNEPANNHMHGYDWESKYSDHERFFHPRNIFYSSGVSVPIYYCLNMLSKSSQTNSYVTSDISIEEGNSMLDEVKLTDEEILKINKLKADLLSIKEINEFNSKYNIWKSTWTNIAKDYYMAFGNPEKSEEYIDVYQYCILKDKKIFLLLLEKLNAGDYYVIEFLEDLTYQGNEYLMTNIHNENLKSQYTNDGVFVIHTIKGNWLKFGKELLAIFDEYKGFNPKEYNEQPAEKDNYDTNELKIYNFPNPFNPSTQIKYNIAFESIVSIKIFDAIGREIKIIVNNEIQKEGWHTVTWSGEDINNAQVSSGIYYCRIVNDSKIQTIKLMLVR